MPFRIAVIPGDGIGPEVIAQGIRVLQVVTAATGTELDFVSYDLGAERYLRTGEILPDAVFAELQAADAIYLGAIGDPSRFFTSRKLVAYLGLDPKVRQSGEAPARSGRISKRGSASARWALVEAAWSVVKQPGPLRAFYERVRARRGHGKAIVATARKLAVLFWCMLTRSEDYAHQRPALTKKKLRELELTAGAKPRTKDASGIWSTNRAIRDAERALTEQAEISYKRMVTDQQAGRPSRKVGASATPERA